MKSPAHRSVTHHISLTSCNITNPRGLCTHQLSVPWYNLITFGSRAFRFSAPRVWNPLPVSIRESQSLRTFKRHLKTFYFQPIIIFTLSRIPLSTHPDSSKTLALSHLFTYLQVCSLFGRRCAASQRGEVIMERYIS